MNIRMVLAGVLLFGGGVLANQLVMSPNPTSSTDPTLAPPPPKETASQAPIHRPHHSSSTSNLFPTNPVEFNVKSIQERAKRLDLAESENVWSRISWVRTLKEAKRISSESGRPIFFFSMYGELDGRC